jgi:hypothetical protein
MSKSASCFVALVLTRAGRKLKRIEGVDARVWKGKALAVKSDY